MSARDGGFSWFVKAAWGEYVVARMFSTGNGESILGAGFLTKGGIRPPGWFRWKELGFGDLEGPSIFFWTDYARTHSAQVRGTVQQRHDDEDKRRRKRWPSQVAAEKARQAAAPGRRSHLVTHDCGVHPVTGQRCNLEGFELFRAPRPVVELPRAWAPYDPNAAGRAEQAVSERLRAQQAEDAERAAKGERPRMKPATHARRISAHDAQRLVRAIGRRAGLRVRDGKVERAEAA